MADNNNINGGSGSPKFNNGKSAEERQLLKNNGINEKKNPQMTILNIIEKPENGDDRGGGGDSGATAGTPVDADHIDSALVNVPRPKKKSFKQHINAIYEYFDISEKSRIPFLVLSILSFLLLIVLIVLVIVWPNIPSYLKADVCIEQECLDSSKQILGWADVNHPVCDNPYKFACGNFLNQYKDHEFYMMNKGEWNFDSFNEYEDINAAYRFISKMPLVRGSSAATQTRIKEMHNLCMESVTDNKDKENLQQFKDILQSAKGWRILPENRGDHTWYVHNSLPLVQSLYGVSPFFKVTVESHMREGNIIAISEGELGLPNEEFYSLRNDHKIIVAYHQLLKDVYSILANSPSYDMNEFVDNLFNYEKRIVNTMRKAKRNGTVASQVMSMDDLTTAAFSLPIMDTVQAIFKETKISGNTPVLVHNVEMLKELSLVVSSSDADMLNDFTMWILTKKFLPLMSRKFRSSLDTFHRELFKINNSEDPWYFCTGLVKSWLPFGLEALREKPELVIMDTSRGDRLALDDAYSERFIANIPNPNDRMVDLIFKELRNEIKKAIENADWIDSKFGAHINNRLDSVRLQIGIPYDMLEKKEVNEYFDQLIFRKFSFIDNVRYQWSFERKIMDDLLSKDFPESKRIVTELFSAVKNPENKKIKYLYDLNMVIISREILRKPYFHYKYPLAFNLARIGTELASVLFEAAYTFGEEYKANILFRDNQEYIRETDTIPEGNSVFGDSVNCIEDLLAKNRYKVSILARNNLFSTITGGEIAQRALNSLIDKISKNPEKVETDLVKPMNLDKRQVGLRQFDHNGLFSLVFLQKHCSVIEDEGYKQIKVWVENNLPERDVFNIVWQQIPALSDSFECSQSGTQCKHIL